MSDLRDLYQEVILDHSRKPRNFGTIEDPDARAEGYNPLCGDRLTVTLRLAGDRIDEVRFEGSGCAISTASASIMTETLVGKRLAEAQAIFEGFHRLVTGDAAEATLDHGKLEVFAGVAEFPARVKCATLAWHTWQAATEGQHETVTTE